jgi:5-methylcytosine-specific restriction endonuclease McrA
MKKNQRSDKIKGLCAQQFNRCAYCVRELTLDLGYENTATVDHANPTSKGFAKEHWNEVACCSACNTEKGDMPIGDWIRKLVEKTVHEEQKRKAEQHQKQFQFMPQAYRMAGYSEGAHPA